MGRVVIAVCLIASGCLLRGDVYRHRRDGLQAATDTGTLPPTTTDTDTEPTVDTSDTGATRTTPCLWYRDDDRDGYGVDDEAFQGCEPPDDGSWAEVAGDCDDARPEVNPGAEEVCDTLDNDCDGRRDTEEACPCPLERSEGDERPYLFCRDPVAFDVADELCQTHGYHLVFLETLDENEWVYEHLETDAGASWIGLRRDNDDLWTWLDGSEVESFNWADGFPYLGMNCAFFGAPLIGSQWLSAFCANDPKAFVCEAD